MKLSVQSISSSMSLLNVKVSHYERVLIYFFFALAFFSALVPISDYDFFWHLSSGQWILENQRLPSQDPFVYTVKSEGGSSSVANSFFLKCYWLSQLIIAIFYKICFINGVLFYKGLIYFLIILFIYKFLKREGVSNNLIILFLLPIISHQIFHYVRAWKG